MKPLAAQDVAKIKDALTPFYRNNPVADNCPHIVSLNKLTDAAALNTKEGRQRLCDKVYAITGRTLSRLLSAGGCRVAGQA